ncbi:GAF domain-containing protein [Planotetraspora thailandica]|nr:GAF domain-containing protein [Planotetraspora thailandica]
MGGRERSPVVPPMRLDELLSELHVRLGPALSTRDHVNALLEAVVTVGGDLDPESVPRRIVESATILAAARCGALTRAGDESGTVWFTSVDVPRDEIAGLEHALCALERAGAGGLRPVRLAHMRELPGFDGFGRVASRAFLGVPIRVRGEVFGHLHLVGKLDGAQFDEQDEAMVSTLACAAGVAIENARLFEATRRRETWLHASSEVTTSLLCEVSPPEVLALMARSAREMTGGDVAAVLLPEEDRTRLRIVIADGPKADNIAHAEVPVEGSLGGRVFTLGHPIAVADFAEAEMPAAVAGGIRPGPVLVVPIGAPGAVRGVLTVFKQAGSAPFNQAESRMLHSFAGQAAIALELAESRRDAERLRLLEDRDRIAKDLHDVVIQRLFGVAMGLTSIVRMVERPEGSVRLRHAIDELDDTIRHIRSTIFALQAPLDTLGGLRSRIVSLVDESGTRLGFMPSLRMDGQLDNQVPGEIAEQALAVLREALSNIVRHAKAGRADVHVQVADRRFTLVVRDNGMGIPEGGRRSGLRNLEERARRLGGGFEVVSPAEGGTRLSWSVPLPR